MIAAVLTFLGVITGAYGTYLMTTAYHPFSDKGVIANFFRVMFLLATLRWGRAKEMIRKAALFGGLNEEDFAISLTGLYFLAFSFLVQTLGSAFAIADAAGHK